MTFQPLQSEDATTKPVAASPANWLNDRSSEIEDAIAAGKMTPAQVFTQMRTLIRWAIREKSAVAASPEVAQVDAMPPLPKPSDEEIIALCESVKIRWIASDEINGDDEEYAFPGSFDMVTMPEMRALLLADRRSRGADEAMRERLRDEEESHAQLQSRCYEGYASATDGIFDYVRELEKELASLRSPAAPAEPAGKVEARLLTGHERRTAYDAYDTNDAEAIQRAVLEKNFPGISIKPSTGGSAG